MKVNLAVSGLFHYHNFAPWLYRQGVLNRFYYAYRISMDQNALEIPADKLVNVWLKAYLFQGHARASRHGVPGFETMSHVYHQIWESFALLNWTPGDLLHVLLHGGARHMLRRAGSEGSVVLGEPVNAHPDFQNEVLNAEYERLKIHKKLDRSLMQEHMIEEFALSDRLLVASKFVKRTFVERGFDESKIDILPYGVNLSRFSAAQGPKPDGAKFRVICVAGIHVRKGQVDLLEAWKRLAIADGELVLVGSLVPEMRDAIGAYEGLFTHIPHIPNQQLAQYFNESTVFVLPSLEDGFGLVCGEAMASGLPVITTENAGAAEIVEDDVNGYVVPIRSPDAIAEKLSILYQDREKAHRMGENAVKTVQSMSGWEGYAQRLVDVYRRAIN